MSSAADSTTPGTASEPVAPRQHAFVTTQWTAVLTATRGNSPQAQMALENLCQTYWPPLYAYVRRRGHSPEDAEDLTQEFFARLLARNTMANANPDKGRFRSFLLGSMTHFLADEWDKARAQKRGGGKVISVDFQSAELRLTEFATKELSPEQTFEHRWAVTLLEQVFLRLKQDYCEQGKERLFEALRSTLIGDTDSLPYAELGRGLEMTEGATKVAVHRLKQRYRALLRETIANTVASPEEVEDELRYLFRTLGNK